MYDSALCAGGGRCFYLTNWQGSTTTLVNQNNTLNATYHYGPYGEGTNWTPSDASTGNPFRYTGRRVDPETGLYYYRARYYSPTLGRFLQTDPVGMKDDVNLYAYTANDPLNKVDPTGKTTTCTETSSVIVCRGIECVGDLIFFTYVYVETLAKNHANANEGSEDDGKPTEKPKTDPDVTNNEDPEGAMDSISKAQDKAKQNRPSIDEDSDDDFGTKTRPKQNTIHSTDRTRQKERHRHSRYDPDELDDAQDAEENSGESNADDQVDPELLKKYLKK